jgi:hypothetical protein
MVSGSCEGPPVDGKQAVMSASLRHEITLSGDPQEQGVATLDRLVERPGAERPPDATLPLVEVDRVMDPPAAVVAPEVVLLVLLIDPNRRKTDWHAAPLSNRGKEGAFVGCPGLNETLSENSRTASGWMNRSKASPGTAPDAYPPALLPERVTTLCFREVGTSDREGRLDSKTGYF